MEAGHIDTVTRTRNPGIGIAGFVCSLVPGLCVLGFILSVVGWYTAEKYGMAKGLSIAGTFIGGLETLALLWLIVALAGGS